MNTNLSLNTYFDKIFYINLKSDITRNENICLEFQKNEITNFERFEAIELTSIPDHSRYRNFNKKDLKYILTSLSCRASHIECVRLAKQRKYSKILIFEDDVVFLQNPNALLAQNANILNDWDMLYFGGLIEPAYRNQIVCTHAYAIRRSMFDDILNMAEPSGMEIDNFYAKILQHMSCNYNQSGKYDIRIITPFNQVIQSNSFNSNIR